MRKTNLFLILLFVIVISLCSCSKKSTKETATIKEPTINTTAVITDNIKLINPTIVTTTSSTTSTSTTTLLTSKIITTSTTTITSTTTTVTQLIITTKTITEPVVTIKEIPTKFELYDALLIRDRVIPLTFAEMRQSIIDNCEVLYPTGYVFNVNTDHEYIEEPKNVYPNTILFGHNYKSFSILNSLTVGETFDIDVHGQRTTYEIQRSEDAYLNDAWTKVYFYSDDLDILNTDYGYDALILFTCSNRGRWIIVAKPI